MALTRDQILSKVDIEIKEIEVPEWGDTVFIRQLTRGEQDTYLKRQVSDMKVKQDKSAKQEITMANIYGHDAFLCSLGICDENGRSIFTSADVRKLEEHNGEVIGRIAVEILNFSGMGNDGLQEKENEEVKN